MREIKFRFWNTSQNNFQYDKLVDGHINYVLNGKYNYGIFCQYTGLKDIHGKEIYEADIVKGLWFSKVVFEYGMFKLHDDEQPLALFCDVIEVIGNIYETPELMDS